MGVFGSCYRNIGVLVFHSGALMNHLVISETASICAIVKKRNQSVGTLRPYFLTKGWGDFSSCFCAVITTPRHSNCSTDAGKWGTQRGRKRAARIAFATECLPARNSIMPAVKVLLLLHANRSMILISILQGQICTSTLENESH